jgi:pilus assembly protein Flp/PilA
MNSLLKRLAIDNSGVTAIEYGLIAAGIGVAILTVVNTVGGSLVAIFTTVSSLERPGDSRKVTMNSRR